MDLIQQLAPQFLHPNFLEFPGSTAVADDTIKFYNSLSTNCAQVPDDSWRHSSIDMDGRLSQTQFQASLWRFDRTGKGISGIKSSFERFPFNFV
jgi:hypothetical protein